MLVLTRKHDEQIVIGDEENEIVITILKIQGGEKVSIGIQAHPNTPIFRKELLAKGQSRRPRRKKETALEEQEMHESEEYCDQPYTHVV